MIGLTPVMMRKTMVAAVRRTNDRKASSELRRKREKKREKGKRVQLWESGMGEEKSNIERKEA